MELKTEFAIIAGIVLASLVTLVLLAPSNAANYVVIDTSLHKTPYRLIGVTSYDFNNVSDISRLPMRFDGWIGSSFKYPERVYKILNAKIILSRAYTKGNKIVFLDIINSDRRKSFHDPRICYSAKWNIIRESVVKIPVNKSIGVDYIYADRLDLVNKKSNHLKLVAVYWFMFRGGEGITMFRLNSYVNNNYNSTFKNIEEFSSDLLGLVYKKLSKPESMFNVLIDNYGFLGYVLAAIAYLPSIALIGYGILNRRRGGLY